MAIKVITDSTSDLPLELANSLGIEIVPLNVHFGDDEYKDRVDLMPRRFYEMLTTGDVFPRTSQPSVGEFIDVYERLAPDADGIVSIHVSEKVSGTMNSARLASQQAKVDCPIEVVDTYQASMGVGLVALEAARVANSGGDMSQVTLAVRDIITRCQCFVLLDTLEYLHKGGRIGKAQAMLGNLLRIRPLIIVQDGEVHPLGKERTRRKGVAKLIQTTADFAPILELAVMYSTTPNEAMSLASGLSSLIEGDQEPRVLQFGPTLGTYVGPGALGIGLISAKSGG